MVRREEAALHGRRDLLFELHRNVSDPWNVQVDWAFSHCVDRVRVKLLKFLFDSGVD